MLDTAFTGKLIIALCAAGNWNLKKQTKREILIRVMKMENEIEYLRAKIAVLKLELNRVRAERDAAIADLAQIESGPLKMFEVSNGYAGYSYVRVYVISENAERAVESARSKFKKEAKDGKRYPSQYWENLHAELMCDDASKEYCSEVMD